MSSVEVGVIHGIVVHGKKKGSEFGYPTLNIAFEQKEKSLPQGVYICRILLDDIWYEGVMHYGVKSIGTDDNKKIFCEVHVFNFNDDVYGESVAVNLLKKIRDVGQFDCEEDLIQQINNDIIAAHNYLSTHA